MPNTDNYWKRRAFSRRGVLRGAALGVGGLAGTVLVGCGDDDDEEPTPTATQPGTTPSPSVTASPQTTGPKQGGTLRFAAINPPGNLVSPRAVFGGTHQEFLNSLGDAYVYVTSTGTFDASLSLWEEWEQPDSTTIRAKIRPGVSFHDGTPFNARSVVDHLEFMTVAENVPQFGFFSWLNNFADVEAVDDSTVVVRSKTPDASFLSVFALAPGVPFSLAQMERLGDDELRKPALTGAYILDSYTEDVGMTFVANPDYWGSRTFDTIDWQHVSDQKIKAGLLESGDLDAAWFYGSDENTERLSKDSRFAARPLAAAPSSLEMNHARPGLVDLRVRQAIASALDKQKVVDVISRGQGRPTLTGLMPPGVYGALEYEKYPFDMKAAKEYLDASGVETPLKLIYSYSGTQAPSSAELVTIQIFQESLRQIGIDVELLNSAVSYSNADSEWRKGEVDFVAGSPGIRPDPSIQYNTYLHSSASLAVGAQQSSDPVHRTIDNLIQKSLEEFDSEKREEMFFELQRLMVDNLVCRVQTIDRLRWLFHSDKVVSTDEAVNAPGGAGPPPLPLAGMTPLDKGAWPTRPLPVMPRSSSPPER